MQKKGIELCKLISAEDIVYVFGEWKLHSPSMFAKAEGEVPVEQALEYLHDEVMGRIRSKRSLN
jgi:hypothetical protein